jgi:hypothetical protein
VESVDQSSVLALTAPEMWRRATSPEGINYELRPILRMTMPPALRGMKIDDVQVGVPLGRSWILLGGLIPIEYDDLHLAELEPGHRFLERSSMLSMRVWQHERTVEQLDGATSRVTDRLTFELRRPMAWIPGSERLARAIVAALFHHRHRRLAQASGAG